MYYCSSTPSVVYYRHQEERRRVYPAPLDKNFFHKLSAPRKMKIYDSVAIGERLHGVARFCAPAIALCYLVGFYCGTMYHQIRANLIEWHKKWVGDQWQFSRPHVEITPPSVARPRVIVTPQPLTVDELIAKHTQRQLMALADTKRKLSKRALAERIYNRR